ncbi:MAG: NAD(P)-dependent glycerol-3-phosphate dehydrogenase [Holosporaceae bacterium]|jgi:glycerol-3-phosphate dehydrogenase (NAD(P)+)|nr:NAD(P)-dependent glycerol-3-phosphate dehydrogenase [Holosporaceae bacterium]
MGVCFDKICIVGAGSYGTALAQCLSQKSNGILLISDMASIASSINEYHVNKEMLDGIYLSPDIRCSTDIADISDSDLVFVAVPASVVRTVCQQIADIGIDKHLVLCSKGIDIENACLITEMVEQILSNDLVVFSGPSFAQEMARGLPVGINVAGKKRELADHLANALSYPSFRLKAIDDYIGLQVAGAFKNVLAVGAGILAGFDCGNSAAAKLIVDGLEEVMRLAVAMGGKNDTFFELGGIGDTILTCTGTKSRNAQFGKYLAVGGALANWNGSLVEGALTGRSIPAFEKKYGISMPICHAVHDIIYAQNNAHHLVEIIAA